MILTADEGSYIKKGDIITDKAFVRKGEKATAWYDITEEEKAAYEKSQKEAEFDKMIEEGDGSEGYVPPTLESLKADKLAELEALAESHKVISVKGIDLWMDADERHRLIHTAKAYATEATSMTVWRGGVPFIFSPTSLSSGLARVDIYENELTNTYESHKAAIVALTSMYDVYYYDVTTGWKDKVVIK